MTRVGSGEFVAVLLGVSVVVDCFDGAVCQVVATVQTPTTTRIVNQANRQGDMLCI